MPELPEVESARRSVHERCIGSKILEVHLEEAGGGPRQGLYDEIVLAVPQAQLRAALLGKTLRDTGRRGKLQWWCLDDSGGGASPTLVSWHFGMTGMFSFKGQPGEKMKRYSVDATTQWPPRFTKAEVVFSNGARLAFTDPRRLGRVRLPASPQDAAQGMGPDALLALPPLPAFGELLRRAVPLKALLLDQTVLAGIGNYLADEM
jgi:formamidopyrimidine-DNA glycosylase